MNAKCAFPKRYGAICLTYVPYLGSGSTWTGHKRLKIKPPSGSDGGKGVYRAQPLAAVVIVD